MRHFLRSNLWSIISGLAAAYFLWVFHLQTGFPPTASLSTTSATYLALFVFFLVAPFVQKFRLGKIIEFEARVEEARAEIKDVRTENREFVSTMSTVVNAVSNVANQSVVVNVPSPEWAKDVREELSAVFGDDEQVPQEKNEIHEYMEQWSSEPNFVLAWMRRDFEIELRRILYKRTCSNGVAARPKGTVSARAMFRTLASRKPKYQKFRSSFDYVLEVCNAVVHGQKISTSQAQEAIYIGFRVLQELKSEKEL